MKERYHRLNPYHKTGIWAIAVSSLLAIALIPLFFYSLMDIPLGILLGGYFGAIFYFIIGFNQKKDYDKTSLKLDVTIIILRFILFAGAIIGLAFLYYKAEIKIFNIFAFTGSYLLTLLIYLFISRKEGQQ